MFPKILPLFFSLRFLFLVIIFCSSNFYCAALDFKVRIPVFPSNKGPQIRKVLKNNRNIAIIFALPDSSLHSSKKHEKMKNWAKMVEASASKLLTDLGYYTVIDLGSRKHRLREVASSQAGLTQSALNIGEESQAHSFFILRFTKIPEVSCKIEELSVSGVNTTVAVTSATVSTIFGRHNDGVVNVKPVTALTSVNYANVSLEGKLVNISTGISVSDFRSRNVRKQGQHGDQTCPDANSFLSPIIRNTVIEVVSQLSPRMGDLEVNLIRETPSKDRILLSSSEKRDMKQALKIGYDWAKEGDLEEAKIEWDEAMRISKSSSAAAIWNLGVYYWQNGELEEAKKYFVRFKKEKRYLLNPDRKKAIVAFNKSYRFRGK